jgi:hypothetical protein
MKRIVEETTDDNNNNNINRGRPKVPERKIYISHDESLLDNGPYSDPFDLHVHRYEVYGKSKVCKVCNKRLDNLELSTTSETSSCDIDKKFLIDTLKRLDQEQGQESKDQELKEIKYNYSVY